MFSICALVLMTGVGSSWGFASVYFFLFHLDMHTVLWFSMIERNPCLMFSILYKRVKSTCDSLLALANLSQSEWSYLRPCCVCVLTVGWSCEGRDACGRRITRGGCALKPASHNECYNDGNSASWSYELWSLNCSNLHFHPRPSASSTGNRKL